MFLGVFLQVTRVAVAIRSVMRFVNVAHHGFRIVLCYSGNGALLVRLLRGFMRLLLTLSVGTDEKLVGGRRLQTTRRYSNGRRLLTLTTTRHTSWAIARIVGVRLLRTTTRHLLIYCL